MQRDTNMMYSDVIIRAVDHEKVRWRERREVTHTHRAELYMGRATADRLGGMG